jgi:hypothetical protein
MSKDDLLYRLPFERFSYEKYVNEVEFRKNVSSDHHRPRTVSLLDRIKWAMVHCLVADILTFAEMSGSDFILHYQSEQALANTRSPQQGNEPLPRCG